MPRSFAALLFAKQQQGPQQRAKLQMILASRLSSKQGRTESLPSELGAGSHSNRKEQGFFPYRLRKTTRLSETARRNRRTPKASVNFLLDSYAGPTVRAQSPDRI